jgi:hypothetical protein
MLPDNLPVLNTHPELTADSILHAIVFVVLLLIVEYKAVSSIFWCYIFSAVITAVMLAFMDVVRRIGVVVVVLE